MKILLVILRADPARGGAERYTIDLADGLRARGHDVKLAAHQWPEPQAMQPDEKKQVLIKAFGESRTSRYVSFLDHLDVHLSKNKYDIVHAMLPVRRCDVYHPHAGIAAEAIETGHLKHSGIKRALAKMGNRLNIKRRKFAQVEKEMIEGRDSSPVVLCLSDYVAGNLRKHYPNAHAEKLFNAVDLAKFDPAKRIDAGIEVRRRFGIGANKTVMLMVAQDFERKGLQQAMEALRLLDDPQAVLLVVGRDDVISWQVRARELGIADRVIFAGATDDPYAFYKAADLFVLPTKHDPCSLVVLEALAMGVPVISTLRNGACEIMTDGLHGSVLPDPENVKALADAIRHWSDPGRRKTASELCLQLRGELSHEKHLDRVEEIYRHIFAR